MRNLPKVVRFYRLFCAVIQNIRIMKYDITEKEKTNDAFGRMLKNYNLECTDIISVWGPSVVQFRVKPAPGTAVSIFKRLEVDFAISLGVNSVRVTILPDCIGIEVPRKDRQQVYLSNLLKDDMYTNSKAELPVILGENVEGVVRVEDLTRLPNLLVAGATKQGKTVFLRNLIMSLIRKKNPDDLKFVLIDPKGVEFKPLEILKNNYLAALPDEDPESGEGRCVAQSISRSERILSALCLEMEERYELLQKAGVREIKSYNSSLKNGKISPEGGHRLLPYIVCICDEYADLVMGPNKKMQNSINKSTIRLAQKGRAVGIHMVISTQRPCTDVITGLIKANFPARAAFRVASRVDSMVILDSTGAEKLSGNGDMLFSTGLDCERMQAPLCPEDEMEEEILKEVQDLEGGMPYYLPVAMEPEMDTQKEYDDPLFDVAKTLVIMYQRCSFTMLQRKLSIGFNRASRLVEMLKDDGIIGEDAGKYVVLRSSLD